MDLYLDPKTNDIVVTQGRFVVVDEVAAKKGQRIRNRIMTVRGSWFLDKTHGVDYHGIIWVKSTPMSVKVAHIKSEILKAADPGDSITRFEFNVDTKTRKLFISVDVAPSDGDSSNYVRVQI